MAQPRFQYLVFLDLNGFILLDIEMGHPDAPPHVKDMALNTWSGQGWARNDLSVLGPLVNFPDEEEARNAHRSSGNLTKLVGNDLEELLEADWTAYLEPLFPEKFLVP